MSYKHPQKVDVIKFTSPPKTVVNSAAKWQPTNMKIRGVRVWFSVDREAMANLHRVGRYGDQYFYSWTNDYPAVPNYRYESKARAEETLALAIKTACPGETFDLFDNGRGWVVRMFEDGDFVSTI